MQLANNIQQMPLRVHVTNYTVYTVIVFFSLLEAIVSFITPPLIPLPRPRVRCQRVTDRCEDISDSATRGCDRLASLLKSVLHGTNKVSISDELAQIIGQDRSQLVHSIVGATPDRLVLLLDRPKLITQHPSLAEHILRPNSFVLSTEQWFVRYLKLTSPDASKIHSRWPSSGTHIQNAGKYRLKQWFGYFLSKEIGLTGKELQKMVISRPTLISYKLSNIQSTARFFREEVGLSGAEFRSIILSYPSVLTYSIANRLRPHVSFLQNEIGGGESNWKGWRKVVCTYPQFFSHSLEKTLRPKINFFCDKSKSLRLKRSELSQVVAKFPPTLWLSDDNLKEKFKFMTDALDLNSNELKEIVVTYPQLLGLSLEKNLKPKMAFFLNINDQDSERDACEELSSNCGLSKNELKEFVLYQPALLAYSLEGRLKPRIHQMESNNISFRYCPKNIMSYTNEKFESWMSSQTDYWTIVD